MYGKPLHGVIVKHGRHRQQIGTTAKEKNSMLRPYDSLVGAFTVNSRKYVDSILDQQLLDNDVDVPDLSAAELLDRRREQWDELRKDEDFQTSFLEGIGAIKKLEKRRGVAAASTLLTGETPAEYINKVREFVTPTADKPAAAPAPGGDETPAGDEPAPPAGDAPGEGAPGEGAPGDKPPEDPAKAKREAWNEIQGALQTGGSEIFNSYWQHQMGFKPDSEAAAADVVGSEYTGDPVQDTMIRQWQANNTGNTENEKSFGNYKDWTRRQSIRLERSQPAEEGIQQGAGFFYRDVYKDKNGRLHQKGPVKFYDPSAAGDTGIRMGESKANYLRGLYGSKEKQAGMAGEYFQASGNAPRAQHYFEVGPDGKPAMKGSVRQGFNRWSESMGDALPDELRKRFNSLTGDTPATPSSFYGSSGQSITPRAQKQAGALKRAQEAAKAERLNPAWAPRGMAGADGKPIRTPASVTPRERRQALMDDIENNDPRGIKKR